jgi:hypothetical protein
MKNLIRQILREEVSEKLKTIIKNKLSNDLKHAEIMYEDETGSIWLIDREKQYWYLELDKERNLLWRYNYFIDFFNLFSMDQSEFQPIITEWVEDILKRKVNSTVSGILIPRWKLKNILKQNVDSAYGSEWSPDGRFVNMLSQNR